MSLRVDESSGSAGSAPRGGFAAGTGQRDHGPPSGAVEGSVLGGGDGVWPHDGPAARALRRMGRLATAVARKAVGEHLYPEQWFLGVRRRAAERAPLCDMLGFELIVPPPGRSFADPFVLAHHGRHWLFFEDLDRERRRAVISCVELGADGSHDEPRVVLECTHHLAYPYVFTWSGEVYMIPDTWWAERNVQLYRAVEFPWRWERECVLVRDVLAADATLFEHAGRFWLFLATPSLGGLVWENLTLFFADSPLGPFRPHPCNPIVRDARSARPAGRPFVHDGVLVRPAQDCSKAYGRAIVLNRVDALTESTYRETPMQRVSPCWLPGNRGTHTYNFDETFEVVDAVRVMPLPVRP